MVFIKQVPIAVVAVFIVVQVEQEVSVVEIPVAVVAPAVAESVAQVVSVPVSVPVMAAELVVAVLVIPSSCSLRSSLSTIAITAVSLPVAVVVID